MRKLESQPLTLNTPVAKAIPLVDVPAAIKELGRGRPERCALARAAGSVQVVGQTAHGLTN
ncbi:hypothetical protein [Streptomyces sp. NBC_01408]|uniref:hypothetical protein n=1 Tax=Streptomyces sp. NBC_01408 TaxID=2903855 RepID=UPI0022593CF9|nr:hypothetical protein [Streptomyces sp. NBC_01408]MCX4695474.1 hypothetical protein [Streptomyces sp. NBC_01408]